MIAAGDQPPRAIDEEIRAGDRPLRQVNREIRAAIAAGHHVRVTEPLYATTWGLRCHRAEA